ncbi:hypothetical protein BHF71_09050 [Vulcanibacillus modesticaldus]|uniref:Type II secretion system protein GspF domain-containing protein n=1 Tax=Vulcanibacillus modesticaldus TaxID=337097 RepID=A0A1D2YUR0_9BACI|nr:hypothetical protein [Vulcanibacillus modesticaldus]OEF99448.1 hypothetical protein BHF71_09050 [Vulcanibacillus modesticaldus]
MLYLFDKTVYMLVYSGLIIGVWLLIFPIIYPFINRRKMIERFRFQRSEKKKRIWKNNFIRHLEMLLSVTLNANSSYSLVTFIFISLTFFLASYVLTLSLGNQVIINFLISMGVGLIPYLLLLLKLHNIRVNTSYEAETLITELINQYKINYLNMIEAIDQTIPRLKKQPYSKKALFRLSLAVKQYGDVEELEEIIQEFNFSIDTSWSLLLANNLFLSIEYGDDVQVALEDIIDELKDLKNINEKNKQYNHETFLMIKYIAPGTYLFSVYAMFQFFGFTTEKFIEYQFKNNLGMKLFILVVFLILINFIVYLFIKRPKNDF